MTPASFIRLEELPLTPNGKVDRKLLAARDLTEKQPDTQTFSSSHIQQAVLAIWQDVLKSKDIELDDRFLMRGDSLLAVTVTDRMTQELDCEFSVTELFEYATVKTSAGTSQNKTERSRFGSCAAKESEYRRPGTPSGRNSRLL